MKKQVQTSALAFPLPQEQKAEELKSWALVELYGHARIVGLVTSNPIELPGTIRVDVPDLLKNGECARKGFTRYFGKAAIYSLTPCDEDTVRKLLPSVDGTPSRPYHLGGDLND